MLKELKTDRKVQKWDLGVRRVEKSAKNG